MMKKMGWVWIGLILCLSACSGAQGNKGETTMNRANDQTAAQDGNTNESVDPKGRVKLVFSTFYLSNHMQTAVKKYEKLHPNIEIELQATPSKGKDLDEVYANIEKFVTSSNTAILAGKGPDLIELDMLPADKYVSRHLLVNLSDMMEKDSSIQTKNYFTNILDNSKIGGGLYGMPLYFSLAGLIGDEDALEKSGVKINDSSWTWSDFADIAKQLTQKGKYKNVLISEPNYMLNEMVAENYPQLVTEGNGKANFDSERFAGLMQQIKTMFDDGLLYDNVKGGGRGSEAARNVKAYFNEETISSLRGYLLNNFAEHSKLYTKPHPQDVGAGGYFKNFGMIGISTSSPYKKEAWDFIKFLIEDEAQSYTDLYDQSPGFPINRIAYEKQLKQLKDEGTIHVADLPAVKVNNASLDQLDAYITGAVHSTEKQSKIDEIITNESKSFFSGQKSASSVSKLVQNKINLYLNE
ncbi:MULTISPECIES: ABC transporter substrate-binding protein [unclassified Paenibacillus]|uniref:ABC transporter substrate-binding protein n=1 Tax=unclassified Paenibacillus TaxID=185978 RepID=UPI0030F87581